jgi:CBS domain-containing protein
MQLKEFINYRVETVRPDDTLQHAAEKMRELAEFGQALLRISKRVLQK